MTDLRAIAADLMRDGLSPRAEQIARLAILDTCGVILAGADSQQARRVVEMQEATGGAGMATGGAGMADRALWYGTAAHALDFDDYEDVGSTHPSACIVAALLAVAETRPVTTGAMLEAYVQGYEAILAFGRALGHAHYLAGWHATGTLGGLGAAAAVARLTGATPDETAVALSIACTLASGLKRQFGSDIKALHCGLAARNGVEAALLARAGLSARFDVLDGSDGFLAMMGGQAARWHGHAQPRIEDHPPYAKPWPSCAYTHRAVEAAEALSPRLAGAGIDAVTLEIAAPFAQVAGHRAPTCEAEARFSVSYCVASTLIDGALTLDAFLPAALARADVQALESLIALRPYPLPPGAGDMSPDAPDRLTLRLSDGRGLSHEVAQVRGGPGQPMRPETLIDKFAQCGGDTRSARRFLTAPVPAPFQAPTRMSDHEQAHSFA